MKSCNALFGEYLDQQLNMALGEALVEKCELDIEERKMLLGLKSEAYISAENILKFRNRIKDILRLNELDFSCSFIGADLSAEACADLAAEIRRKNASLNGFFNGAQYEIKENTVTVSLKYGGYDKICELGFSEQFCRLVKQYFGLDVEVIFDGQLEAVEMVLPPVEAIHERPREEKPKAVAPKTEITFEKRSEKPENNVVYLDNPKLFYGKRIDSTHIKPMIEVTEEDSEICCWGEVFGLEVRTINTRRGQSNVVSFNFSDYTNSLTASMFMDTKRMDDIAPLKDGAFILLNGTYVFDNFKKEFQVKPNSMALLQKYEEKDEHEGLKRVELHCHTNMSAKDAVSSGEDIVNRAFKWGHKAIAITDHGVVQAYPAIAGAVKKIRKGGGDFKVIYGVEAYFVDDIKNDISNMNAKQIAKIRYHQIILVKNLAGLKNLYKLVSEAHLHDYYGRPITLRSKLDGLREGLILGSACEQGELYQAIIDGVNEDELLRIADYYDYLEIQPLGNNEFMVRQSAEPDKVDKKTGVKIPNKLSHVTSLDVIKDFNRKVVELADKLSKPVVATGDVHFLKKEDDIIRKILMAGQGFDDFDHQAPLYL